MTRRLPPRPRSAGAQSERSTGGGSWGVGDGDGDRAGGMFSDLRRLDERPKVEEEDAFERTRRVVAVREGSSDA